MWNLKILFQKHAHEIQRVGEKSGHGQAASEDVTREVFLRIPGANTARNEFSPDLRQSQSSQARGCTTGAVIIGLAARMLVSSHPQHRRNLRSVAAAETGHRPE